MDIRRLHETRTHVILLGDHADTVEAQSWPVAFDAIRHEPFEAVAEEFDVVLPADHLTRPPHLKAETRAAFLVHDVDALDRLRGMKLPGPILFQPTALARVELHRRARKTLKLARDVAADARLAEADLAEETGGAGISASLKTTVLGRRVLYDLSAGTALDFGVIEEDDWRKRS